MASVTGKIGYARISPLGASLADQKRKLKNAGCTVFFVEDETSQEVSRAIAPEGRGQPGRLALHAMLRDVGAGDLVVVWRLDRLGRSIEDLADIMSELSRRKVGFKSLYERIDTTEEGGDLILRTVTGAASLRAGNGRLVRADDATAVESSRSVVFRAGYAQ